MEIFSTWNWANSKFGQFWRSSFNQNCYFGYQNLVETEIFTFWNWANSNLTNFVPHKWSKLKFCTLELGQNGSSDLYNCTYFTNSTVCKCNSTTQCPICEIVKNERISPLLFTCCVCLVISKAASIVLGFFMAHLLLSYPLHDQKWKMNSVANHIG